jgi:hypothetical protein
METYPVDIDPAQVVRWIQAEHQIVPSAFTITARRTTEVRELPVWNEAHLGDEEREDLSEIATIATLEIAPVHAAEGWLLSVVVEDEIGPRLPNGAAAGETEREIDIGTFYSEFIRPGRGDANVTAEAADPAARARLAKLFRDIETNRHEAGRRASKA